ncbi:MAG TPA: hypothetical protein IAB26_08575 [Candidatus Limivivens merdigallinarum]|uniref:Uncharacterized protein n=1 Tax=Candidatus Limivivens merdigallinarum TaxID=2840859 RepID=A0A9D1D2A0_9FIRM|nr:hypothetical protein [Candidatus Limivivens merdigallinarum]
MGGHEVRDLREPGRGKKDAQSCAWLLIQTIAQNQCGFRGKRGRIREPKQLQGENLSPRNSRHCAEKVLEGSR